MPKIEQKTLENTLNLAKIDVENLENGLKKLPDTPVYSYIDTYIDINDLQGLFHTIYVFLFINIMIRAPTGSLQKNMGNMGFSATRVWDKYGTFSDFSTKIGDIYGTYWTNAKSE